MDYRDQGPGTRDQSGSIGKRLSLLAAGFSMLLLAGCVAVPSGPSIVVLPGTNKSFDQV